MERRCIWREVDLEDGSQLFTFLEFPDEPRESLVELLSAGCPKYGGEALTAGEG